MEKSCNTRKIENVTRFQLSLKWSHFLVTLFVTLLGVKNCYNTKSEHFSNKNVTFCYIFALTPLIPPIEKYPSFSSIIHIFFQKSFLKMLQMSKTSKCYKTLHRFFPTNVENNPTNMLYLHLVIPPIILLSGREASSSSFFVAIGGIIFFCTNIPVTHFRSFMVRLFIHGLKTQDDFHGLKFKADVFKNGVQSDKNEIVGAINCRPMFMSYIDDMFNNARRKINKLSQYYNGKIDSVYDDLKNDKKVDFESLKEYDEGPDSAQFTYNDFETIGERYSEYSNMTEQMLLTIGVGIVTIVLIGMTAACRQ